MNCCHQPLKRKFESSILSSFHSPSSSTCSSLVSAPALINLFVYLIVKAQNMMVAPGRIRKFLSNVVQNGPVPEHVAFIMDGNRRYAKRHRMRALVGHYHGAEALENVKAPISILHFIQLRNDYGYEELMNSGS